MNDQNIDDIEEEEGESIDPFDSDISDPDESDDEDLAPDNRRKIDKLEFQDYVVESAIIIYL